MKKKLSLDQLKVQSFITELKPEHAKTAQGGLAATETGLGCISFTIGVTIASYFTCDESTGMGGGSASVVNDGNGCNLPDMNVCG